LLVKVEFELYTYGVKVGMGMTKFFKQNAESPAFCWRIIGNQSRIVRRKPSFRMNIAWEGKRPGWLSVPLYSSLILLPPTWSKQA